MVSRFRGVLKLLWNRLTDVRKMLPSVGKLYILVIILAVWSANSIYRLLVSTVEVRDSVPLVTVVDVVACDMRSVALSSAWKRKSL